MSPVIFCDVPLRGTHRNFNFVLQEHHIDGNRLNSFQSKVPDTMSESQDIWRKLSGFQNNFFYQSRVGGTILWGPVLKIFFSHGRCCVNFAVFNITVQLSSSYLNLIFIFI